MEMETPNKKRTHFSREDDLMVAREVLGQNPFENSSRWGVIQQNILQISGKNIAIRTLRDRIRNLMQKFSKKDKLQQFKSGIEEEVDELDDLIRHIVDLFNEYKNKNVKLNVQDRSSYQKGFLQRENILNKTYDIEDENQNDNTHGIVNLSPLEVQSEIIIGLPHQFPEQSDTGNNTIKDGCLKEGMENEPEPDSKKNNKRAWSQRNILNPTRKRVSTGIKNTTINYLEKKNERSYEIKIRELALQERKQTLQEKKFELEKWERQKKSEMEEKRLSAELQIFANQQKLMEIICERFKPT